MFTDKVNLRLTYFIDNTLESVEHMYKLQNFQKFNHCISCEFCIKFMTNVLTSQSSDFKRHSNYQYMSPQNAKDTCIYMKSPF